MSGDPPGGEAGPRIGWWWLALAGIALLLLLSVAMAVPFTATVDMIDAVTGERCTQHNAMFLGGVSRTCQPTALSRWLAAREPGAVPRWSVVMRQHHNVFGRLLGATRPPPPAIARLLTAPLSGRTALEVFVEGGSEEEIAAFVSAMSRGGPDHRRQAVSGVLDRLSQGPGLGAAR